VKGSVDRADLGGDGERERRVEDDAVALHVVELDAVNVWRGARVVDGLQGRAVDGRAEEAHAGVPRGEGEHLQLRQQDGP
jgi:hypothetical protein